jgi:hypothetical protein
MKRILAETQSLIQEKRAEYKSSVEDADEKQAKGLDMSGAGDDSPKTRGQSLDADQAALEPQKKPLISDDADAEPPSDGSGTPSQAKNPGGGDDSEMTRGHALDSDEAADTPTEAPLITDTIEDKAAADAPTAKLANDILGDIRAYQEEQKVAEEQPEAEKVAEEQPEAEKVADEQPEAEKVADEQPAVIDVCAVLKEAGISIDDDVAEKLATALQPVEETEKVADEQPADADAAAAPAKQAEGLNLELTTDVLAKIAAHILSTTEGAEYVEGVLAKEAGATECREILSFLADQSEIAEKQAAFDAGSADAEALHEQAIYQQGVTDGTQSGEKQAAFDAGAADAEALHEQSQQPANDAAKQAEAETAFYAKLGQSVADASIAGLMGGAPGADMGGEAVSPEMLAAEGGEEVPPEMLADEGGDVGAEEGGDVSPEELMAALETLVAEGTISEEEAMQVLEYISGGAEEGAVEEGALPEAPPAEEAAPPASGGEADEGMAVEASADLNSKATDLLNAIKAAKASK